MTSSPANALESRIERGEVIVMDGGTGSETGRRGVPTGSATWSADALVSSPDIIRDIHEDYLRAGAEIIITNTFATSRTVLEMGGLGGRTAELNRLAVALAREARANVEGDGAVVAGGVGAIAPTFDPVISDFHEQTQLLADAGVDVIALEMLTRLEDTEKAVAAAAATGLPTWAGLACHIDDGEIRLGHRRMGRGESLSDAVKAAEDNGASAIFVMHTLPQDTEAGLREARRRSSLPIGAYADADRVSAGPEEFLDFALRWVDVAAQVVGGCCGTNPEHVGALKRGLPSRLSAQ